MDSTRSHFVATDIIEAGVGSTNELLHSQSGWLVILCVICALLIGAFVLMSGLAIAFEQYFTIQIEASRKISQ